MNRNSRTAAIGMEFPCTVSVKVFVRTGDNLELLVREIILRAIAEQDLLEIGCRSSSKGRYQSFSCRINAIDRKTLDAVFIGLSQHPEVLMVI